MKGGTIQISWHDGKPVLTLDFHPVSGLLATAGADYDIKLWLLNSGQAEKKLPSVSYQSSLTYHGCAVNTIRFSRSGELLASGADGGELIIWKLHPSETNQSWKVHKSLSFHRKDVLDLQWSPDDAFLISGSVDNSCLIWDVSKGSVHQILDAHCHYVQGVAWDPLSNMLSRKQISNEEMTLRFHRKDVLDLQWSPDDAFLISGSVDNSCIIWDVNKGSVHQILDAHCHYVQGVAWDPLSKYVASLSSDRTCRIYVNKPQAKSKSGEKMNYVCQHVITKADHQRGDDTKTVKTHLFHDETLPSDGSFLLIPSGSFKISPPSEAVNATYIFSRKELSRKQYKVSHALISFLLASRPALQLPGANKPVVVVRFCPVTFKLRGPSSEKGGFFKLPYRIVFAIATFKFGLRCPYKMVIAHLLSLKITNLQSLSPSQQSERKQVDAEEKKHVLEKTDELMTETVPDETSKRAESKQDEEKQKTISQLWFWILKSKEKKSRFHRKDVLDLQWSPDDAFLISGSVDNSCLIWDVSKGSVHQILDAHCHYVQGVAWDPLSKYVASLSSDRTCRIYVNKPQAKSKSGEKMNYVCQHVITKADQQRGDDTKTVKTHLFHDETLPSFFRRLSWSPDGSFLLIPSGSFKISPTSESVNATYVFSRKDLSRPALQLPGANKPVVVVRFCPVAFKLRGSSSEEGFFKLPYRIVFAIATLNSVYIYDTECVAPIAVLAGLHYAAITDITWSPTASYLALSSQDGYCTLVEFEDNELGEPISISVGKKPVDGEEKKHVLEKTDELMTETVPDERRKQAESNQDEEKQKPLPSKVTSEEEKQVMQTSDEVMTETKPDGEKQPLQSKVNTPVSSKPARRRITPMAIDP
ncbi:hypothetical protein F2Q70_00010855 [Brassica cretica]|uniref:CAF1B/HIR1 beta-propeller domain-containing protein n=1 Tax=Brassica cretica TaxID=69181 RepID=A0A8S9LWQ8_BRACR|nr:hypothetical protein F2Q70_00010855 [Brassica cretica]